MRKIIKRVLNLIKNEYFLLSLILIIGFGVRLYKINNPIADWHSWRQADTASVTREYVENGINFLQPTYHDISSIQTGIFNWDGLRLVEFPIYNVIHALLSVNFPFLTLEVWGRLLSIFFALVSGLMLYLIGKSIFNKWIGILSTFFFLTIPFNIYFTRVILPEPAAVSFGLLAIYFFIKFIEKGKTITFIFSSVFFALAMLVKPFMFFYSFPIAYLLYKKFGFKSLLNKKWFLVKLLIYATLVLVPFLSWRVWINNFPRGIPFFTWAFNGDGIRFKPSFWKWIFAERLGSLILGVWGLIPFVFGMLKTKGKLFTNYFLLGVFAYVSLIATASVRHDYYQTLIIPAVALTLAIGTSYLLTTQDFGKYAGKAMLFFSLFVMYISTGIQVKALYNINRPEIMIAGAAIDRIAPEDALVIAPYNGDTAFLYQTKRSGWPVVDTSIEKLVERGADYFVAVNLNDPDVAKFSLMFKTVESTPTYIILDLNQNL